MKIFKCLLLMMLFGTSLAAQDAVIISEGNFVRGIIKGTNYRNVALQLEDQTIVEYQAKDIQSFLWNGETYVSKPILVKKRLETRFFKLVESGAINLYTFGSSQTAQQAPAPRVKVRPSIGIGLGSGGFGGGLGGGISIGGGNQRNATSPAQGNGKISYFLEKPGAGPMQEIVVEHTAAAKALLLQKLTGDEDLSERVKASESFTELNLIAFVKAYNAGSH